MLVWHPSFSIIFAHFSSFLIDVWRRRSRSLAHLCMISYPCICIVWMMLILIPILVFVDYSTFSDAAPRRPWCRRTCVSLRESILLPRCDLAATTLRAYQVWNYLHSDVWHVQIHCILTELWSIFIFMSLMIFHDFAIPPIGVQCPSQYPHSTCYIGPMYLLKPLASAFFGSSLVRVCTYCVIIHNCHRDCWFIDIVSCPIRGVCWADASAAPVGFVSRYW